MLCLWAGLLSGPLWAGEPDIRRDATVRAIEQVIPSVVNIATETVVQYHDWYDQMLREFYGTPRASKSVNLGSGVIIDSEGYVLTNFHVIRRATRILVKLWDGRVYEADPIVATSGSDVAFLKLRCQPGEKFTAIKFADDDDLILGETVLALGNPFGLGGSVSRGILSSKNRRPSSGNEPLNVEDWLQTDASINPGNSGGPLVDLRGELIGVNVAVYQGEAGDRGMGVGFSIPVKQVSAALSLLFTPEISDSLWFGAQFRSQHNRLEVRSVQSGSPAAKAGLREGDQVLALNGTPAGNLIPFSRRLGEVPQHVAHLRIRRGEQVQDLAVHMVPFGDLIKFKLGLVLSNPPDWMSQRLGTTSGQALLVKTVEKDGPADQAGLAAGTLLKAIDGQPTGDLRDVVEVLAGKKPGDTVQLSVRVPRPLGGGYVELLQGDVPIQVR